MCSGVSLPFSEQNLDCRSSAEDGSRGPGCCLNILGETAATVYRVLAAQQMHAEM